MRVGATANTDRGATLVRDRAGIVLSEMKPDLLRMFNFGSLGVGVKARKRLVDKNSKWPIGGHFEAQMAENVRQLVTFKFGEEATTVRGVPS